MSRTIALPALAALVVIALLPGCTTADAGYPSLLPRPIEARGDAPAARPEPLATPDATLDAQIARWRAAADAAGGRFDTAAASAATKVAGAKSAAIGSETWIDAQSMLADLIPLHNDLVAILGEMERTASERAQAGQLPYPALDSAVETVAARVATQAERKAQLEAMLPI